MEWILILAVVLLAFAFGVGGYAFFAACGRRDINWLDEKEASKSPFGKYYTNILMGHTWLQDHGAQDVYTTSHDGLKLHATWVPVENARGTMILVHGYHSCVLTDFAVAFDLYHRMGMNLLLPTQRAHGKSEGKYVTFGVLESRDMQQWVAFHNANFGEKPVIFSGLSMGASTVMFLADEKLPANVKGLLADCGFSSPKAIIAKVFRQVAHLPAWPFLWATELFARMFGKFSLTGKDSCKTLAKNTRPILMVHGVDDDFVPCEMTRQGYAVCAGDKKVLLVEGATHGISFLKAREEYMALVMELLGKCLEDAQ